jgi:hypothetical protein
MNVHVSPRMALCPPVPHIQDLALGFTIRTVSTVLAYRCRSESSGTVSELSRLNSDLITHRLGIRCH